MQRALLPTRSPLPLFIEMEGALTCLPPIEVNGQTIWITASLGSDLGEKSDGILFIYLFLKSLLANPGGCSEDLGVVVG